MYLSDKETNEVARLSDLYYLYKDNFFQSFEEPIVLLYFFYSAIQLHNYSMQIIKILRPKILDETSDCADINTITGTKITGDQVNLLFQAQHSIDFICLQERRYKFCHTSLNYYELCLMNHLKKLLRPMKQYRDRGMA